MVPRIVALVTLFRHIVGLKVKMSHTIGPPQFSIILSFWQNLVPLVQSPLYLTQKPSLYLMGLGDAAPVQ